MDCSVCQKSCADRSTRVDHIECSHVTHIKCMPGDSKEHYKLCSHCANIDSMVRTNVVIEPHPEDNVDYFDTPGSKPMIGRSAEEKLLDQKVPVHLLLKEHKRGVAHFLKVGLKADDFFRRRYCWNKELKNFPKLAAPENWFEMQRTFESFGLDATSLRDYPHLIQMKDLISTLNIPEERRIEFVRDVLGLEFHENEALSCNGDNEFNALDCAMMGLKFDDLKELGMESKDQYDDLFLNLTPSQKKDAVRKLGASETLRETLLTIDRGNVPVPLVEEEPDYVVSTPVFHNYEEEEEEEPQSPSPPIVRQRMRLASSASRKIKQQQQESSSSSEEEEPEPEPRVRVPRIKMAAVKQPIKAKPKPIQVDIWDQRAEEALKEQQRLKKIMG